MIVPAVIVAISTVGVGFYVRFVVELCRECKQRSICYLVRLESHAMECSILDSEDRERWYRQAA